MTTRNGKAKKYRIRIKGFATKAAAQFQFNPLNWRRHGEAQRDALRTMLGDVGWVQSVIENKRTGNLIDGHARIEEALREDPKQQVPYLVVDLSPEEEKAVLATLDPIGAMAEVDQNILGQLYDETITAMPGLEELLTSLHYGDQDKDDGDLGDHSIAVERAAEFQKKWQVKRGQVWQLGAHRLMCGDATSKQDVAQLMAGQHADICFTSPPYNVGGGTTRSRSKALGEIGSPYVEHADELSEAHYFEFLKAFTENALEVVDYCLVDLQSLSANKRAVIDYQHHFRDRFADVAIWHKTNCQPAMAERVMNSAFEYVFMFAAHQQPSRAIKTADFRGTVSNVFTSGANSENQFADIHGAAFSVEFCRYFVGTFSEASVLDLFLGTGTTLLVAEHLGRVGYGMELTPAYCAVTLERLRATFPKLKIKKVRP